MLILAQGPRSPVAPYESDYLRGDAPAYHWTPMKRVVSALTDGTGVSMSIQRQRAVASVLRLAGLLALLVWAIREMGWVAGPAAFVIFVSLPPTLPVLTRLDPWMDSVCYSWIALLGWSLARVDVGGRGGIFVAGVLCGLAVDSKATALLTLAPASVMYGRRIALPAVGVFLLGVMGGMGLSAPAWLLHPSLLLAHLQYWQSVNAQLPALPVFFPWTALGAGVPCVVWILAIYGACTLRRQTPIRTAGILFAVPVVFFMVYRSVPPEGVRHLYMALPFLSAVAASGWMRVNPPLKVLSVVAWLLELNWRVFTPP